MKSINEYKDRFFHLLETEIGDVKPIINEQVNDKTWTALETTFGKSLGKDSLGGVKHKVDGAIYNFYDNGRYYNGATNKMGNWRSDWNSIEIDGKKYPAKSTQTPAPEIVDVSAGKNVFKQGMVGKAISEIQNLLAKHGFFKEKVTTYFGPKTLAAVKASQTAKKIKVDGIVGKDTLSKLQSPVGTEELTKIQPKGLQQMQIQNPTAPTQIQQNGKPVAAPAQQAPKADSMG